MNKRRHHHTAGSVYETISVKPTDPTVYNAYEVGSLLVWDRDNPNVFEPVAVVLGKNGFDGESRPVAELLAAAPQLFVRLKGLCNLLTSADSRWVESCEDLKQAIALIERLEKPTAPPEPEIIHMSLMEWQKCFEPLALAQGWATLGNDMGMTRKEIQRQFGKDSEHGDRVWTIYQDENGHTIIVDGIGEEKPGGLQLQDYVLTQHNREPDDGPYYVKG